ncbi:MAG: 30S ribosomal protein S4 [Phycisphaerae bacterium]
MANYCGPKVRLTRKLGVPICETSKHVKPRNPSKPGMVKRRRSKLKVYGTQLLEKQKIASYYNISNKQLRRYMQEANGNRRNTIVVFQELLERRLDNVVRRASWCRTIWQARQMVAHGHFLVNGRKVDRPSYRVKPGDVITTKERSKKFVKAAAETAEVVFNPSWLGVEQDKVEAEVKALPTPEETRLPFEVNFSLIVEFYTR